MSLLPAPLPVAERDFSKLTSTILEWSLMSAPNGYEDEDFAHYVYEAAMEAVYGPQYWAWRNKQR